MNCKIRKFSTNNFKVTLLIIYFLTFLIQVTPTEDENMSVPDLIEKNEYPCETHKLVTHDGYILTLHRIPHGKNNKNTTKKVVFLQHCLLCSSAYYILSGPGKALAYVLADAGYDVWMGNSRGNFYSRNHTKFDPNSDKEFWNFSLDELGLIDLPASIDYVLEKTRETKLFFIGHSQGCTSFYIMTSVLPEYNEKIRAHFSLAPVVYLKNLQNTRYAFMAFLSKPINNILAVLGVSEIFPKKEYSSMINSIFFKGYGQPAGTSRKVLIHFGQQLNSGHFRPFDQGILGNLQRYHSFNPPDFDLGQVTADVWLFYCNQDWVSSESNIEILSHKLTHFRDKIYVEDKNFSHMDFLYGENAAELVYFKIIKIIDENYQ